MNERTIQDPRPLNGLMALLARIAVYDEGTASHVVMIYITVPRSPVTAASLLIDLKDAKLGCLVVGF